MKRQDDVWQDVLLPGWLRAKSRNSKVSIDLLKDSERREQIAERAGQTIKEYFSWDRVCSKTLAVYNEALGRSGKELRIR